jgi:glutamate racemase
MEAPHNTSGVIGVFDSGIGGLSVLRHLRKELPNVNFIYCADSAYAPYGDKSKKLIQERSKHICEFLLNQGSELIVVACNTATAASISLLRKSFSIPIIGLEPGVKPGAKVTKSGVVGILATVGTIESDHFKNLVRPLSRKVRFINQACPGLVEKVEMGTLDDDETKSLLSKYVEPLLREGVDTLVLGCSHYPFLRETLESLVPRSITIIDTGPAVAIHTGKIFSALKRESSGALKGTTTFWTSGSPEALAGLLETLWGPTTPVQVMPQK